MTAFHRLRTMSTLFWAFLPGTMVSFRKTGKIIGAHWIILICPINRLHCLVWADQIGYPQWFQDALGYLWAKVVNQGASTVGLWPNDGYEFEESKALTDDKNSF